MSDQYAVDAVIRWADDGAVEVLWAMENSTYGFRVDPIIFDQMHLLRGSIEDEHPEAPVVMQLLVMDE